MSIHALQMPPEIVSSLVPSLYVRAPVRSNVGVGLASACGVAQAFRRFAGPKRSHRRGVACAVITEGGVMLPGARMS
jgi:hypothetical protein